MGVGQHLLQAGPGVDLVRGLVVRGRGRTFHLALNTEHKCPNRQTMRVLGFGFPGLSPYRF